MTQPSSPADSATEALELSLDVALKSRGYLVQRLSDVVCWPVTRIAQHERELAGDVLVGLLRSAGLDQRRRCAERLALLADAPKLLLRYLARDEIDVARPLLEASKALDDADLVVTVRAGVKPHWQAIAARRSLSELVVDALIATEDVDTAIAVLKNPGAKLSFSAIQTLISLSREAHQIAQLLAGRSETTPAQALTMFWWADASTRLAILRRFAVDRAVLCGELADVFALCAKEGWSDPESRKAIALLERRQRNRLAAERSPHGSLEAAIAAASRGVDNAVVAEISHMCGIRPATGARIFNDRGGEGVAVLCKATGLKRDSFTALWTALRRNVDDEPTSAYGRALMVFDTLATAKAQTVLRYWNWSLTSSASPLAAAKLDPNADDNEFAPARRSAALVFGVGA